MRFHMIEGGPTPVAPFSHAVEVDGMVYVTGQMPDSPATPGVLPDGIVAQTHAVMANLALVLAGLGLAFEHVVMARVYLTRFKPGLCRVQHDLRQLFPGRPAPGPHLRRRDGPRLRRARRDRPGRETPASRVARHQLSPSAMRTPSSMKR